jgi:mRNA interferase MazF
VRLDPVEGSEQTGERPALVISPDLINQHSPVVLVAAITSGKTDKLYRFDVIYTRTTHLSEAGII